MNLNEFAHKLNHDLCPICGCTAFLAIIFALFILVFTTCFENQEVLTELGLTIFLTHIFMTILWILGIWALRTAKEMRKLDDAWELEKENEKIL